MAARGERFAAVEPCDSELEPQAHAGRGHPAEPPELEFGTIELENGSVSFAVLLRREVLERGEGLVEITKYGGWRAYRGES